MDSTFAAARAGLVADLAEAGQLTDPRLRAAVEAVPRELFLSPGVFLAQDNGRWMPVDPDVVDVQRWAEIAYSDESLVTQLDGRLTTADVSEPLLGKPTSSSTLPSLVVDMIERLKLGRHMSVLEIGTGTGYSGALLCSMIGPDNVTTIEVDPEVARRADDALEAASFSTWTLTGDGLIGWPKQAPYDRVICTCAVRRIPYAWVRQTRPGGIILATVGSGSLGSALARVTVQSDGTATGSLVRYSSFMQARSQVQKHPFGNLEARAFYADSERECRIDPDVLNEPMPSVLAWLAAPGAQHFSASDSDGGAVIYLIDADRESFATLQKIDKRWHVREGGPLRLWSNIEQAIVAWELSGKPDVNAVNVRVTRETHTYQIDGHDGLTWEHHI